MIRHTSVAMLSALALLFSSVHSPAQEKEKSNNTSHLVTEFKPLTFWDKVRIGGAYFTDPSYVRTVRIAYGFDADHITQEQVAQLVKEGVAVPAMVNSTTGNALTVANFSDWKGNAGKTVLLSDSATLLGQPHSTVWLTQR